MDTELNLTPPEIVQQAKNAETNLLPKKSQSIYELTYKRFMDYRMKNNIASFSENVMLAYFGELIKKMKSSTLWSVYSMLKTTLNVKHSIDLTKYLKLRAFLKRSSDGYVAKKSKTFGKEDIQKFLIEAPDDIYLSTKVALIFGVAEACRCDELLHIRKTHIEDMGNKLLVTLPDTKTKKPRTFIVNEYLDIYRKYVSHRPTNFDNERFFYKYFKGKAFKQLIGIHRLGSMPQEVAKYLQLPNSNQYTGHCFRRTSATLLVNSGGDITMLKRHGGWRSTQVAEGYIDESLAQKSTVCEKILSNATSHENYFADTSTSNENISSNKQQDKEKAIIIQNCSQFTVNIYKK